MKNEELDQLIEKSFQSEPQFQLPANFAEKVLFVVVRREQLKSDIIDYLNMIGVILFLASFVSGFYYFINKEMVLNIFQFISGNILPVILIGFILNFILFTDRVLLRLLFNRWNRTKFRENGI